MPRITPDLEFIKELQAVGGESVKKCYQCATCSVACPISPSGNPYPRKEMIWAQWGLKDRLLTDIDVWLCHNCGTCSDLCPRGANPGDLLAAIRNMTYRNLVGPSCMGKLMSSAKGLPVLIGIPAVLFLIVWIIVASIKGSVFPLEGGEVVFGSLFPGDYTIDPIFMVVFFFMVY
ncbi:MAG: 4Fe-4S dicluster domain-containing protein, partial [Desulfovibrio sp.]|nr:4Fe-4S dicluster domain-containing protein [Desulfovibrio sp.]